MHIIPNAITSHASVTLDTLNAYNTSATVITLTEVVQWSIDGRHSFPITTRITTIQPITSIHSITHINIVPSPLRPSFLTFRAPRKPHFFRLFNFLVSMGRALLEGWVLVYCLWFRCILQVTASSVTAVGSALVECLRHRYNAKFLIMFR